MQNTNINDYFEKIQKILRQTNYSEQIAFDKLQLFNNDEILVIEDYLGIKPKLEPIKSINQAIYKEFRYKLNDAMCDYNKRVERGEVKKII